MEHGNACFVVRGSRILWIDDAGTPSIDFSSTEGVDEDKRCMMHDDQLLALIFVCTWKERRLFHEDPRHRDDPYRTDSVVHTRSFHSHQIIPCMVRRYLVIVSIHTTAHLHW